MKPQHLTVGQQIEFRAQTNTLLPEKYSDTFVQLQLIEDQIYIQGEAKLTKLELVPYDAQVLQEQLSYFDDRLLVRIDGIIGQEVLFSTISFAKGLHIEQINALKLVVTTEFIDILKKLKLPTTNVIEWLNDEFLLDDYAFAFSQKTLEEINLVGKQYIITFKQNNQSILTAFDLRRHPRNIGKSNIALLSGAISFQDNLNDAQVKLELERSYKLHVQDNEELLQLWKLYGELELATVTEESKKVGFLPYYDFSEFYNYEGKRMGNFLVDKRPTPQFRESKLGFAVTLTEDNYMSSTFIGSTIEGIQKHSENEFQLTIQIDNPNAIIPSAGYLCASIVGSKVMNDRRNQALEKILNGTSALPTLKYIIQNGEGARNKIKPKPAITDELLKKTFKGTNGSFTLKQEEAINMALNTNDLVIIQGPPGTGKTTVIRSIVHRINKVYNGRANILISSAQHDAVDNAIENMEFCGLPAKRIGGKMGEDKLKRSRNIIKWLDNVVETTENVLQNLDKQLLYKTIRDTYGTLQELYMYEDDDHYRMKKLKELASLIKKLPNELPAVATNIEKLVQLLNTQQNSTSESVSELQELLKVQRITIGSFLDDGALKLGELIRYFRMEEPDFDIPAIWLEIRLAMDEAEVEALMPQFSESITDLLQPMQSKNRAEVQSFEQLLQQTHGLIDDYVNNRPKSVVDVLLQFQSDLESPANIKGIIEKYTKINASTCQQAVSSKSSNKKSDIIYDYIIIDEAARANPLDLIIPMSLGSKIILVGDHKQLPHILEPEIVAQLMEKKKDEKVAQLLKNSLFERLYNSLNKRQHEFGVRTAILTEQYRMHPVIGKFVSNHFYEGKLRNGVTAEQRMSHFQRYNAKPIVWLNTPAEQGPEKGTQKESKYRPVEVERLQQELYHILQETTDETIGIITFYKRQLIEIEKMVKAFPEIDQQRIDIGTVDSFQGKEFDIVFLSTVRSNKRKEVGFVSNANRLNVAFSRAKRVLVVIGDRDTICGEMQKLVIPTFAQFEQLCQKEGYYEQ